jgi:hypothetical protein
MDKLPHKLIKCTAFPPLVGNGGNMACLPTKQVETLLKYNTMNTKKRNLIARKFAILRVRHLVMPRVKWHHYLLISIIILPNLAGAYFAETPILAMSVGIWLFIPCKDRQFGNGKKYYWIRQTVFGLGTILCVWAGVA